jgi:hypothetical protein
MALRFRRSITLFPGFKINLGKKGASLTVGAPGASINVGKNGTYSNLGVPGTGMSVRTKLSGSARKVPNENQEAAAQMVAKPALGPDPGGRLVALGIWFVGVIVIGGSLPAGTAGGLNLVWTGAVVAGCIIWRKNKRQEL